MDDVDRRLLAALRARGRASWADLGRQVGLSGPAVAERVGRLERAGVLTGYSATVDPAAVGLGTAALVGVLLTEASDQDRVLEAISGLDEVEDCWFVAGEESYLLKVRVPDVPALESTISRLRAIPGVSRTRTTVVLSTKWEGRVTTDGLA